MESVVQWSPDWLIGVDCIDSQHQVLVKLLALLQQQLIERATGNSSLDALAALLEYTEVHFGEEETYMQMIGYPKLSEQQEAHRAFIDRVQKLVDTYRIGKSDLTEDVVKLLVVWLYRHIAVADAALATYIKQEGLTPPESLDKRVP